ncbi:PAS domain S-box protein [Vibrio sp. Of7-15]|uniref:PAS domain S-box protein n=1 Tax=Vibrio sp. Of7-15 TaxID=2724879 RepID=UPI001EF2FD23|nr:PAS domain S-box protein [Vibrio sp. Of7-15]MCG7499520.1 PAS domain S-box protein [Vibrio sp. Of7-15]
MNLTIKTKIWLFIVLIMLLMLGSGLYSSSKLQHMGQVLEKLTQFDLPLAEKISNIKALHNEQTIHLERYFRSFNTTEQQAFGTLDERTHAQFSEIKTLIAEHQSHNRKLTHIFSQHKAQLDALENQYLQLGQLSNELIEVITTSQLKSLPRLERSLSQTAKEVGSGLYLLLVQLEKDALELSEVDELLSLKILNHAYLPTINNITTIKHKQLSQQTNIQALFRHLNENTAYNLALLSKQISGEFVKAETLLQQLLTSWLSPEAMNKFSTYLISLKATNSKHEQFKIALNTAIDEILKNQLALISDKQQLIQERSAQLNTDLDTFLIRIETEAFKQEQQAEQDRKQATLLSLTTYVSGIIIAAIAGFILVRNIVSGLNSVALATKRFSSGDLTTELVLTGGSEISNLTKEFNLMRDNFRDMAEKARNFAAGDESQLIEPKTDSDELGIALSNMMKQGIARTQLIADTEARTRAIIDTAVDGIIIISEKGLIENLNPAAEKLFQYAKEELIGNNINVLMPSPYREEHDGYLANYRVSGIKKIIGKGREVEGKKKDGSVFPISLSIGEILLGNCRLFTGIVRDISAERQAKKLLEQSEEKGRAIINNAQDGIILITEHGLIESFNPAAERLFGYKESEVVGKNIKVLMPSPFHEEHDTYLENYRNSGIKKIIGIGREVEGKRRDGSCFPIALSVDEITLGNQRFFTGIVRDITQIKASELKLKESEIRSRGVIETAVDGIIIITDKGIIEDFNPASERLFGYKKEQVIGKNIKILMPSPYTEEHDSYLENYKNTGIKKIIGIGREVSGRRQDGTTFPVQLSVGEMTVFDRTYFTGVVRDISAQKNNEKALIERTKEMELQNWFKSQVARVLKVSSSGQNMLQLTQTVISELADIFTIGHGTFYMSNHDQSGSQHFSLLASYAYQERKNLSNHFVLGQGLIGQAALEKKAIHLTQVPEDYIKISSGLGEKSPLNIIAMPIVFENQVLGVIELASFTAFEEIQLELLQQISDGLGVIINNSLSKENIEKLLDESKKQSEELQTQQEELKASNEELQSQTQALQQSQAQLEEQKETLEQSNTALEERQLEIKKQNEQLEQSRAELEKKSQALALSSKYKSEFLANMSHELRTPLNSLLILSKSLSDNKEGNLTDKQIKSAKVIHDGGSSLLEMINDILDLSKVEAGKLEIEMINVDLKDICHSVYAIFEAQAIDKRIQFTTQIPQTIDTTITTDSHRVEQILRNFLSNAFKFTESGTIDIQIHQPANTTTFTSSVCNPSNMIGISISDTGMGISEDKLDLIFEAFQQQDGSISRKYGGTGLGLTISRELAHLLGGEIQVTSQINQGSIFSLYLPTSRLSSHPNGLISPNYNAEPANYEEPEIYDVPEAGEKSGIQELQDADEILNADAYTPPKAPTNKSDYRNHILIVEDDKIFADELERIVKENGFSCLRANTGREALYQTLEHHPRAVLLDIGLPDIDGFEVIEQIKANSSTRRIPVHVISGADCKSDSLSHGAYGFSMKPVSEDDVKKSLLSLYASKTTPMKKILVVEDDSGERIALDVLLTNDSTDIQYASSGKEACDKLTSDHDFDCLILDLGLPDMSGIDVLDRIQVLPKNSRLPVIIYTGKELEEDQQAKLHSYACDIIIKGAESPERLMDDITLFVHSVSKKEQQTISHDHSSLEDRKVLLVDDDIRNVYALSSQLEQEGMLVEVADNGQQAVKMATENRDFELILMDIMMPEMDGFEATRRIRKLSGYESTPIIALTAKAMPEDRIACVKAGASEYLAKPVNMDRLLSMLKVWLYKPTQG